MSEINTLLYRPLYNYSTIMSFYHIRSREQAKYEAVKYTIVSWFNRFTTGRILADGEGATMANKIRMFWILLLENKSQNNIFLLQYIINLSFNGLA